MCNIMVDFNCRDFDVSYFPAELLTNIRLILIIMRPLHRLLISRFQCLRAPPGRPGIRTMLLAPIPTAYRYVNVQSLSSSWGSSVWDTGCPIYSVWLVVAFLQTLALFGLRYITVSQSGSGGLSYKWEPVEHSKASQLNRHLGEQKNPAD